MQRFYGITRVDQEFSRTHAWKVAIQRRNRIHTAQFSDGVYGGKQAALHAAMRHRDELVQSLRPLSRQELCRIRKKNNRSGIPGVTRIEQYETQRGRKRLRVCWVAQWPVGPGRAKQRKFSVRLYGERGAFMRALRTRRQALAALSGRPWRRG